MKHSSKGLGIAVRGEVGGCDLVALGGGAADRRRVRDEASFNLELVLQGVDGRLSDEVWLAARGHREGPRA